MKAGYVIRRILRRAIRYGYQYLNISEPFIHKISQTFIEHYCEIFPELKQQSELIEKVIKHEEITFLSTLERGIKLFEQYIENNKNAKIIDGQFAFELYDTYGFPIDLTQLMAKEKDVYKRQVKDIVVAGGGYIGIEMAEACLLYTSRCV